MAVMNLVCTSVPVVKCQICRNFFRPDLGQTVEVNGDQHLVCSSCGTSGKAKRELSRLASVKFGRMQASHALPSKGSVKAAKSLRDAEIRNAMKGREGAVSGKSGGSSKKSTAKGKK